MYEYIILVGNSLEGVFEAIGPFDFETDAEQWLKENSVDSNMSTKILVLLKPEPDPYNDR